MKYSISVVRSSFVQNYRQNKPFLNMCLQEHKLLSVTYKVLTTNQPQYLHNMISLQPCHNTRSSSVVTLARPSTRSSLKITNNRSFWYSTPSLWNELPTEIRGIFSLVRCSHEGVTWPTFRILEPLHNITRGRLKLETANVARILITRGTNEKNAKIGQRGSKRGLVTYFRNLGTPPYLPNWWS